MGRGKAGRGGEGGRRAGRRGVGVGEGIEEGIPERAAVGFVAQDAEGEDVWVDAGGGVHGVGAGGGVDDWL